MESDKRIKILFVESVDDDITRRRHGLLASDSRLNGYELHYFYATILTPEQQAGLAVGMAPDLTLSDEELFGRLEKEIQRIHPRFVFLHTGFVFRRFPSVFIRVFARLKQKYPNCRFGLQPREGLIVNGAAFDQTDEVVKLQRLIFTDILQLGRKNGVKSQHLTFTQAAKLSTAC
jgi:hypothetical protein